MKVYVLTEVSGHFEDRLETIMGIFEFEEKAKITKIKLEELNLKESDECSYYIKEYTLIK